MTATIERDTARTTTPVTPTRTHQDGTPTPGTARARAARFVFAGIRIALGWTFLWAFLDKTFGLGFATEAKNAWIDGGSPTKGFLAFGAEGPFQGLYHDIAGAVWADWLFMAGLLGLGVALLLGIGMRIAAVAGGLLYVMMWTVVLPPENNPFMDDHLINAALLAGLALVAAGDTLGLGRAWAKLPLVQRFPWLR
ncbi:thiosulfate dehydrogenase [quinone] large subunit [Micromonospora sagamiensis]|uniref:Thiosulfate dehydrogenase [quinone] large subunit n=2 Tax=Micromonospora sagamiensis TaxID=47875 RepID=A0A562WG76_9ACTN|nr:thiosulfate dehydrogenase [quinone] large subunit [Micromonospora sagamiensis]